MNYKIFQIQITEDDIKNNNSALLRLFFPLKNNVNYISLIENGYKEVYSSSIDTELDVLSELYEIFNISHPKDFYGRSLSVSVIVYLENDGYYYCQPIGWKKVNII